MTTSTGGPDYLQSITPALPTIVDRAGYQAEIDKLRDREKELTREYDAVAAARRRLPMIEVDATIDLIGPDGPMTLLDAFDGRRQLIVYTFMWHAGKSAAEQCEGCTWCTSHIGELAYLHSRDITFAVVAQGPYRESARYRDFMGWQMPWYAAERTSPALKSMLGDRTIGMMHLLCFVRDGDSVYETWWTTRRGVEVMDTSYSLMDLTVWGRQEPHEESPIAWPQRPADWHYLALDGRPMPQWSRLAAGRSDDLDGDDVPASRTVSDGESCCIH